MAKLTQKQERFCQEYLLDLNATQAAIRAGYSKKTARSQGQRLLTNVDIAARIQELQAKWQERTEITQDWVLETLKANVDRSMQAVPVTDREGNPTGEFKYEGSVANKGLELIGKHIGMFKERHEHSGPNGGPVQYEVEVSERVARYTGIFAKLANGSGPRSSANGNGTREPVDTSRS